MSGSEIRSHIHNLIDNASDAQLDAVLRVLELPYPSAYSEEDLDTFYERLKLFETAGSKGFSVEESHAMIRSKNKQHGV